MVHFCQATEDDDYGWDTSQAVWQKTNNIITAAALLKSAVTGAACQNAAADREKRERERGGGGREREGGRERCIHPAEKDACIHSARSCIVHICEIS